MPFAYTPSETDTIGCWLLMLESPTLVETNLPPTQRCSDGALQELQMARLELGRVQEMLKPPDNPQVNNSSLGTASIVSDSPDIEVQHESTDQEETKNIKVLSGEETHKGHTKEKQLEGAQARLEILKGTLYKREREITEFLQNENNRGGSGQYPCGALLRTLVEKFKQANEENKKIVENYNSERVLRKKYYNMVEVMKGKIRVFCRIRPLNKSEEAHGSRFVVGCPDEYSVTVDSARGLKEFQFDKIFNSTSSQEEVFEDTSRLIQSAVDGYNVCIFAYGQTGSGKTFTMIGDKELKSPGVMPRAFNRIFHIVEENKTKFDFKVSVYMLELYNERLLDLFVNPNEAFNKKIEIKKDKKGLVFVQGAETKEAASAEALFALFKQGCMNRHIASTKMNVESSRSHLIIGVTIESTNLTNGSVTYGKLSLVDLAGSERAAKTGAKDEQLKVNGIISFFWSFNVLLRSLIHNKCFG
ncbi:kinesin-like protein KIN-14I [Huso huso]|uniref:Kinesin-like protein n=1 Tax=Huso huso TaxID=61971 RepID=A0ABR1AB73_HUSHU